MGNELVEQSVAAEVKRLFDIKEQDQMRKETEGALQKSADTITKLTDSFEAKEEEMSEIIAKADELQESLIVQEEKIKELTEANKVLEASKADFESEKEGIQKKLEESETLLEEIRKDQAATVRMAEIIEAGVASKNVEAQLAKIRELTDEEFTAYKDETISIKEAIMEKLDSEESSEETIVDEDLEETEEGSKGDSDEETELDVTISEGRVAMAALNMEVRPDDKMVSKYAELGMAMAKRITEKSK